MILMESEREKILGILEPEGAESVEVFGPFARGEADSESDIDILVDFSER